MRRRMSAVMTMVAVPLLLGGVACHSGPDDHGPTGATGAARSDRAPVVAGSRFHQATPITTLGVQPGIHPTVVFGPLSNPYAGNVTAATEGRQIFVQYNCSGCHGGRAGGGMGPSLRDSLWIYGDSDAQIYGTIMEGRSAGMPAWGAKLTDEQIWKLVTYIRTLGSANEPDPPPPPANPPPST